MNTRNTAPTAARMITTAALATMLVPGLTAAPTQAAPQSKACVVTPDKAVHGRAALARLDKGMPASALNAGMNRRELTGELKQDSTLWLDSCGNPFYVEPVNPAAKAPVRRKAAPTALNAGGDALSLHSRPGSARTIFLDFDGHRVADTAWNASWNWFAPFTASAYSMDSSSAFNADEIEQIRKTWLRVAEDYAPFDVDVTTQDPGSAAITRSSGTDQVYGTRVVITNDTLGQKNCGCGGIAFLGAFDDALAHAYFQPAFVFTAGVGTGAKEIAEAASHEAGHNLGLSHDGTVNSWGLPDKEYYTGHGDWAPIMGVGYDKRVTQWSRGEYDNASQREDDYSVMNANGAAFMRDDHGDTRASATTLTGGAASGLIERRSDVDWFTFLASGATTLNVLTQATGANLDARLDLFNDSGVLIAGADPSGLDASLSQVLPAGRYHLRVDGVGFGNPRNTGYSEYGSLGRYDVRVFSTQPAPVVVTTASLPGGAAGRAYSQTLSARGGVGGLTWDVSAGTLPPGLTLSRGGVISGTPTSSGSYPFTLRATDTVGQSATARVSINVTGTVRITSGALPLAKPGQAYRTQLTAAGGTAPYTWQIVSGALPLGLRMDAGGLITGTPRSGQAVDDGAFTVRVRDAAGGTETKDLMIPIKALM